MLLNIMQKILANTLKSATTSYYGRYLSQNPSTAIHHCNPRSRTDIGIHLEPAQIDTIWHVAEGSLPPTPPVA